MVLAASCVAAGAFSATFGFEGLTTGTSYSETDAGLTASFSMGGDTMYAYGAPIGAWGATSLVPDLATAGWVVVDFSSTINALSIDSSDYNADADDLYLEAYSGLGGTGSLLDSDTVSISSSFSIPDYVTLSVASSGINSVRFRGLGLGGVNNLYWDNMVAAVPEPGTLAVLALGGLALIRRRK